MIVTEAGVHTAGMVFDAIMACDEDHAAPLQRDDDVVVRSVEAIQILNVVAGGYAWPLDDEYVRGGLAMKHRVRRGQLPPCLCRQPYRRKRISMAGSMGR